SRCNDNLKGKGFFTDLSELLGAKPSDWVSLNGKFVNVDGSKVSGEVTWSSPKGVNIASGLQVNTWIGGPAVNILSCCADTVRYCIRYTIQDADCNVCDKMICSEIKRKGAIKPN
ncbi:MAG: hypothetical protein L6Q66_14445, partial [Bacteroidia bacterium]|nr:hypothetical protein [Bacteroidia bacterium]